MIDKVWAFIGAGALLMAVGYHVTRLQKLGLVIVKQRRARAGRAIKAYGTIAPAFVVPANLTDRGADAALMAELRKSLAKEHDRLEGTPYYLTANGEPRMRRCVPMEGEEQTQRNIGEF